MRIVNQQQEQPSPSRQGTGYEQGGGIGTSLMTIEPYGGQHFMSIFQQENTTSPERILLKYYVERLAALCTITLLRDNGFQSVLLPMAIDDPSLLYALFAYASFHLSATTIAIPDILRLSRLKFTGEAARGLSRAIQRNTVSASSVACALICSTAEVVSGSTRQWFVHLRGAGHLILSRGGENGNWLRSSRDGIFLLRNFAYHDIMAALSTGTRPQILGVYWIDHEEGAGTDCIMGLLHHRILGYISQMCVFIADVSEQTSEEDEDDVLQRGYEISQRLGEEPLGGTSNNNHNDEYDILYHHAESFRYASLIRLNRFLFRMQPNNDDHPENSDDFNNLIENLMAHLSQIPLGYHCEMGLVFPVFMLGVYAGPKHLIMDYVRQRLDHLFGWTRFEHVNRVRSVLEMLWRSGREDWDCLLKELRWCVSIA